MWAAEAASEAGVVVFASGSHERYNDPMTRTTTLRAIGNSFGVILGKEALAELGVQPGDRLFIVKTPDGLRLTAYDPEFEEAMEFGRDYMRRHRDALRELAK
jgi:putative addiction module antidote